MKDYRDRRAVAASQATVVTSETAPATEEAVVAEAEAVVTAVDVAPVVDEPEPESAAESSPSATAAQSTPSDGGHFSA
ncbi:hypothetical protein [Streptomyces fungicidicus]|uniref:hypothetical protein n=1 Tax=Streptomyces fungicidicus TaxID=68203 RepID=UPI0013CF31F1|nr:hypothetical protein [Streptomyces fungicidicus]